jgi:hypothetical protein
MWVDYDVPNLFPALKNCAVLWLPFLKMATARNLSMSGINSEHHNLPRNEMSLKSDKSAFSKWPPIFHNANCSFKPVVSGRFGRLHNR